MVDISRVALFGKLNEVAYKAIESATVFCKLRGNPYVEMPHWFHQILQRPDGSDLHSIARHFELNSARLAQDFIAQLRAVTQGLEDLAGSGARRPLAPGTFPLPGALE